MTRNENSRTEYCWKSSKMTEIVALRVNNIIDIKKVSEREVYP